jgi:hypothetical protein
MSELRDRIAKAIHDARPLYSHVLWDNLTDLGKERFREQADVVLPLIVQAQHEESRALAKAAYADGYDAGVMSEQVEINDLRDQLVQAREERDAAYAVITGLVEIRDGRTTGIQGTEFDKDADDRYGAFVESASVTEKIDKLLDSGFSEDFLTAVKVEVLQDIENLLDNYFHHDEAGEQETTLQEAFQLAASRIESIRKEIEDRS